MVRELQIPGAENQEMNNQARIEKYTMHQLREIDNNFRILQKKI
jgi:hypothetical protein